MQNVKFYKYSAIVLAMLLWAMSFIWSKLAFNTYNPFTVLFFRLLIATITLFVFAKGMAWIQKIEKADYKFLLLLSFFEPFLYFIGENFGLQLVTPTTAAIIIATIPLFMPLIGLYFFKENITKNNILGVTISVTGVLMVIFNKNFSISGHPIGVALLTLAVVSALGYTIVLKRITYKYNAFTVVVWQNLFATISFFPLFLWFDFDEFSQVGIFHLDFIYIVMLAILASNSAFLLYTYALKQFGISKIGVFTNLIPVFTLIISFFVFNETLEWYKYSGILLVIGGLFLSEKK